jgi:hypothetical protein
VKLFGADHRIRDRPFEEPAPAEADAFDDLAWEEVQRPYGRPLN